MLFLEPFLYVFLYEIYQREMALTGNDMDISLMPHEVKKYGNIHHV